MTVRRSVTASLASLGIAAALAAQAPPNAPAQLTVAGDTVTVRYDGRVLLSATLAGADGKARFESLVDSTGGRVTQLFKWTRLDEAPLALTGTIAGSNEAFSAESDPAPRSLRMVRHTVGLSASTYTT